MFKSLIDRFRVWWHRKRIRRNANHLATFLVKEPGNPIEVQRLCKRQKRKPYKVALQEREPLVTMVSVGHGGLNRKRVFDDQGNIVKDVIVPSKQDEHSA